MSLNRSPIFRILVALTILAVPVASFAKDNVGKAYGGGAAMEWQLKVTGHDRVDLTILGPDGTRWTKAFSAGKTPSVRLLDLGQVEDGQYNYELRVTPKVGADVRKKLDAARAANDEAAIRKIAKEAGLSAPVQSGTFTILSGMIVSPDGVEGDANDSASTTSPRSIGSETTTVKPRLTIAVEDTVIPDDLIVQSSGCFGFDCVDGESFGADTVRLKENNLRIHFEDTSTSAGYASNDWRIVANDQASGGANYLAFEDSSAGRNTFIVEAGAPANALYVDSTGHIGIGQSAPGLDVHATTGDTPGVRLEQTSALGFTAQTWDIGANEANFFVRDLTGGSRLSFRIRPGAPTSSIDIAATGKVGMGTASPAERLHVFENADANSIMQIQNENTGTTAAAVVRADADLATVNITAHSSTRTVTRFGQTLGGWNELLGVSGNGLAVGTNSNSPMILGTNNINRLHITNGGDIGINCNAPTFDLVIGSGGGCSTPSSSINAGSAQFTIASSRTFKENIEPVAVSNILEKIEDVGVYNYDYIDGPKDRMGLIAEDFHEVFGRGSEKYIDGNDVQMALWLAVKELAAENKELTERLKEIENKIPQQ
jgi:hypothetical protein